MDTNLILILSTFLSLNSFFSFFFRPGFRPRHRLPEPGPARRGRLTHDGTVQRQAGDAHQAGPRPLRRPPVAQGYGPPADTGGNGRGGAGQTGGLGKFEDCFSC